MRLAHKLAIESPHIRADMVEAIEFPHLSNKYHVHGVPRTVINETIQREVNLRCIHGLSSSGDTNLAVENFSNQ